MVTELEPLVSVVILTRNRCLSLERAIHAVLAQDYPNYSVVIVDNGSFDSTPEVVAKFGVQYIFAPPDDGFALSRQRGVEATQGDIIAMCDDDCVPQKDWLKYLVQRISSNESIGLVGGKVINRGFPKSKRFKGSGRVVRNGMLKFVDDPRKADYYGSANLAFRRSAFEAVGGYDLFFQGGLEEVDLALSMRQFGFQVVYEPEAVVEHYYTGISYKGSHFARGYSPERARLYMYFKHFYPRTLMAWGSFLLFEVWLLVRDCCRILYSAVRRGFYSVADRVAIPWLVQQSPYKNNRLRK